MKKHINILFAIVLFLLPKVNFGQAPSLGSVADFVLFSTNGPLSATGINHIKGNVGTNNGGSTGFTNVNGNMHDMDAASALCAADLLSVYNQLDTTQSTAILMPILGNGQTLIAGVYKILSAASLNLNLILDAQGNTNAVFIFQIQGAFSANTLSKVKLINEAQACNVYWKVEGLVSMAAGTTMRGTVIANNAAINMYAGDTLEGRALSTTGAVGADGIVAYIPTGCNYLLPGGPIAPTLGAVACYALFSSNGAINNSGTSNISGDVGSNSGNATGYTSSLVSGTIHLSPDASTATAASSLSSVFTYLNTLPFDIELKSPALFGHNLVLTPNTYMLNAATTLTDTLFLDAESNIDAVFIIQVNGTLTTSVNSQIILLNGAQSKNVFWKIDGALTVNANSVLNGTIVVNNAAIILNGGVLINGRVLTTYGTITTTSVNIYANRLPNAGIISGLSSLFVGNSITLSNSHSGGAWSCTNSLASVSGGVVTGTSAGTDTIRYIISNLCGTDTAIKIISILGAPTVCVGATLTLTDTTKGGIWNTSNANALVVGGVVTGHIAGIDTVLYSVSNFCGTDITSIVITVNPLPVAGIIMGVTSLCEGDSTILSNLITGGIWSSSNDAVSVSEGTIKANTQGLDTIRYIVSNMCGIDTALLFISVHQVPAKPIITSLSVLPLCSGTLYQNFSTSVVPLTDIAYNWSALNATIWATSTNQQNVLVNFPNSGNAAIMLSAVLGGSHCESSDTFKINVTASISIIPQIFYFEQHFVCLPSSLDAYQWGYDDVATLAATILTGEINQDYFNANPDYKNKYYWVNTAYGGCNQKTYYNVPLAIQNTNNNDAYRLEVYPNPATDLLNVSINNSHNDFLQINIVDISGQKVMSMQTDLNNFSINVSKIIPGFYYVNCYHEGIKIAFAKFIKE